MAELTEEGRLAVRRCIFLEYRKVQTYITTHHNAWRSVAFRAYKRICETMGDDFVDYPEVEFWFSRFLYGLFNFWHDRKREARKFTDLPLDVFNKIGENLEFEDRMQLRDVSKDIRFQVDNWNLKVDEIYYRNANDWKVCQTSRPEPYCARHFGLNEHNRFRPSFYRVPISFLMNVLKHPKLQLEKLTIHEQDDDWKKLIKRLDESNRKLHVKNVQFPFYRLSEYPYSRLSSEVDLHFLIPGVLEKIKMFLASPTRKELYKIVESEQCQSAEMVHIESRMVTSRFPLDLLSYCPRFTLRLDGSADSLKANFLKKLMKCGEVEKCVLYILGPYDIRDNPCQILKYFNEPEAMVPDSPMLRRYPIPGTNEFYEIEYREERDYRKEVVGLERKQ